MAIRSMGRGGLACVVVLGLTTLALGPAVLAAEPKPSSVALSPESARVELGRRLFFDPAASRTGTRSCADCHDPDHGYSDVEALSRDARGATPRRSQALVDCADSPTMDWLGAFNRIEDVVAARTETSATSGKPVYYGGVITPTDPSLQFVASNVTDADIPPPHESLADSGRYRSAFMAAYTESTPTAERVVGAISAYCRSIRSGQSAYDRFAAGETRALSNSANRGLELFRGKAGCASCHLMNGPRAAFTDYKFHQTGLPEVEVSPVGAVSPIDVAALLRDVAAGSLKGTAVTFPTTVRAAPVPTPRGGFKTPTLRDVAQRGPFMHNGSLTSLEEVVRFFLMGRSAESDEPSPGYDASDAEVDDLVAFLKSLTSATRPGAAHVAWSQRATTTRLRFVDANGEALAKWPVVLAPAGDVLPGAPAVCDELRLVTDADGWVSYVPPLTTHVRLVLEGGLQPEGGCWIPDVCKEARLSIPICGTGHLRVNLPAGEAVPEMLELVHDGAKFFPDRRRARTLLRKEAIVETGGRSIVVYAGLVRTDVDPASTLIVPPGLTSGGLPTVKLTMGPTSTTSVRFDR
jgi:cytochrome c peroxidase